MHLKKSIKIGEFLCSYFDIKMEGSKPHFWHTMLYYFKKGKNASKTQLNGEGAVIKRVNSGLRFHAGDFSLDDAPWLGRPVEVDSDQSRH